jgi:predicted transcriptional regulator
MVKPSTPIHVVLPRRERQIMEVLFRRGRATAAEVMEELPGQSSYSTVRTQLRILENKGHVRHEDDGVRFIYMPVARRDTARKSALRHLVKTFFDGSAEKTVAALLGGEATRVSDEELDRIAALIDKARKDSAR